MRRLIKNLLPPIIYKILKLLLGKQGTYFTGEYKSWNDTLVHCKGYDDEDILNKVLQSAQKVKSGEKAYERDGILFDSIEYSWQVLTGIIWVAARNSGHLCVLDMGGSLGTTYFQNSKFLNEIKLSSWNIVEQPKYVKAGKTYFQDEKLRFFDSIENCLETCNPNVILISCSLQYMKDPYAIIKSLCKIGADAIILDRTIINNKSNKMVFYNNFWDLYYSYELKYLKNDFAKGFERTYGWAWLMMLYYELETWDYPEAKLWSNNLNPLVDLLSERTIIFLDKLSTPLRPGTHANTAFSFSLMVEYAKNTGDNKLLNSKKINELGWSPRVSLDEGLEETYKWYLGN